MLILIIFIELKFSTSKNNFFHSYLLNLINPKNYTNFINQTNIKEELENNKEVYEKIIDDAADKIENFIQKANLNNQIQ